MSQLRWPGPTGRRAMAAAGIAWLGAVTGWAWGERALIAAAIGLLIGVAVRHPVPAILLVAAALSGRAAAHRVDSTLSAAVPEGPIALAGTVVDEPVHGRSSIRFVLRADRVLGDDSWRSSQLPPISVSMGAEGDTPPTAYDRVLVRGILQARAGRVRGDPFAGRISGASVEVLAGTRNPLFTVGNALRGRVASRLREDDEPAAALLRGFLIGDTSGLGAEDTESLRRAGLSHFVAVSGSNVALFLAGWWIVTAPISVRPRLRSVLGLVGLAVFVVVTRWEPSVVRAAAMAGLVLGGRAVGAPIDAWTALGAAVAGLVLLSGDLATSVGFQLSVAATAGVLAGAAIFSGRRPAWLWTGLGATLSAQAAVVPLLLVHFGTVPLLSPLANLIAAPVVTVSTVAGGVGVVAGVRPLIGFGLVAARAVLRIARIAGGWPQLGAGPVAALAAAGLAARWRPARMIVVAAAVAAAAAISLPGPTPPVPTVTFLDIGQGDAVLLQDDLGATVLMDGGPDPQTLRSALRRHGVDHIDLLVMSHGDKDHVGGLESIFELAPVGEIWVPDQPFLGSILPELVIQAEARSIPVERLRAGHEARFGRFAIDVLGPRRRYESENDGSIVLWVEAEGRSILLPGDIEAVAQRELPGLRPDILLVPHHGSATTDLSWLRSTVGEWAVISVGENSYGHPSEAVLDVLHSTGTSVWTTQSYGDVVVPMA